MRLGGVLLGLPVHALREVLPCPAVLESMPAATPWMRGAFSLRGTVIPVLDLRPVLGLAADGPVAKVVVVMRWQQRLLGLLAEAVCGIATVEAQRLSVLSAAPGGAAVPTTHAIELPEGVVTVLDAQRLAELPGVTLVQEPPAGMHGVQAVQHEPVLLLAAEGLLLGVPAMLVDATVPQVRPRASALASGLCLGVMKHQGGEVPVVDALRLAGLARCNESVASTAIVLRLGQGRVALLVDEVKDLLYPPAEHVLAMPAMTLQQAELFKGVLETSQLQPCLLFDAAALGAYPPLQGLARLSRAAGDAGGLDGRAQASQRDTVLTFRVGIELAASLRQVVEIVPLPESIAPLRASDGAMRGLFIHRGAVLPLLSLAGLLGEPETQLLASEARVLIVGEEGARVGLAVEALHSIEPVHWQRSGPPPQRGYLSERRVAQSLVEVGMGAERRTLSRLDLQEVVRGLMHEVAPAGCVPGGGRRQDRVPSSNLLQ
ncbi:chemotaxis protein CheW [Caldimonas tepidiphila]|uniref:chemotaxis protein CheW n=1 Tax=Caldimonas tepidiphila TaxID=2315841 RepID=UPI000E5A9243|nr:chemotaxis protein CheW [Caldimonas tepidiphila]